MPHKITEIYRFFGNDGVLITTSIRDTPGEHTEAIRARYA